MLGSTKSGSGKSGGSGGGETVTMPALGESVTEGTVTRWLKAEGDTVEVDEPLLEVSTDKVDTEIPSPVAGVVTKILVQEDDTVPVGGDLAVIGGSAGGSGQQEQAAPQQEQAAPQQEQQPGADAAHELSAVRDQHADRVSYLSATRVVKVGACRIAISSW